VAAGPRGASIANLMQGTGKGRTWVYVRLRQLADAGRVIQIIRGHWRAALPSRLPRSVTDVRPSARARLRAWGRTRGHPDETDDHDPSLRGRGDARRPDPPMTAPPPWR